MDFSLGEDRSELRDLAAEVLGREVTRERLEQHEASAQPYDEKTWKALVRTGLIEACEEHGPVEMAVLLREIGACVAPVPAMPTLVGALTIAGHGSAAQKELLGGDRILTYAINEPGAKVTAHDGRLHGVKTFVTYAREATHILISAESGVFCVEAQAVRKTRHPLTTGEPGWRIELDGTPGEPLGDGAERTLRRLATAAGAATISGVLAGALKLTTEYVKERKQFGRALAEFQAVTMQISDVYIAARALDVAMWSGAWRLAQGPDGADAELAVAAFNASGAALEALYTCQHLHGGMGLDVTYPLHRYFAWGKHHAHMLGGRDDRLEEIACSLT